MNREAAIALLFVLASFGLRRWARKNTSRA
jgi:hypothetical protein